MTIKDFLKKVILPVAATWILISILAPVCMEQGVCDWRKLLLFAGIPFGIHKMFFLLVPSGFDIGGSIGVVVFNLLIGGVIGSVILIWRLFMTGIYLVIGVGSGILWIGRRISIKAVKEGGR
jgi:hypothetical protein